jgi:16S rRNA (cytosine967-C5)-methyltransferase
MGAEEAAALARAMLVTPPFTVRVNTLKTNREELSARLALEGVTAEAGRFSPDALHLSGSIQLSLLPSFREGLFTVQDESSQMAAVLLAPLPGERVLDLCAAPGGKTTHCAQLMANSGDIIACDVAPRKLELIEQTANRLGITIIRTFAVNAAQSLLPLNGLFPATGEQTAAPESGVIRKRAERFDRILVDAPSESTRTPSSSPPPSSIRQKRPRSPAVLKTPA